MSNTIIQQGTFTSAGTAQTLNIRSDVDWMWIYNYTQIAANALSTGYQFYWQRGMAAGTGIEYQSNAAGNAVDITTLAAGGFTLIDSSDTTLLAAAALTGLTNANPPVVTSAGHGLVVGDIVRFDTLDNQPQIAGMDFTVTASAVTFTIGNIALANSTASTTGNWRRIPFDPIYYPRRRFITFISASATAGRAKVYLSVTHNFTVGQRVRLSLPGDVWGNYSQLDGRECTVVAVNEARAGAEPNNGGVANNIVVDVDVAALGAWNVFGAAGNQTFPAAGDVPFTQAQVIPVGEDTGDAIAAATDILADATRNTAFLGMQLGAGVNGPAGQANDVIYWTAGKSFNV